MTIRMPREDFALTASNRRIAGKRRGVPVNVDP